MKIISLVRVLVGVQIMVGGVAMADPKTTFKGTIAGTEARPTFPQTDLQSKMNEAEGFILQVTCTEQTDCTKVTVARKLDDANPMDPAEPVGASTKTAASFTIPKDAAFFEVKYGSTSLFQGSINVPPSDDTAAGLAKLATTVCQKMSFAPQHNEVMVTPLGGLLTPMPQFFSENDALTVTVVGDKKLVKSPLLSVKRTSAARVVTAVKVLGDDVSLNGIHLQAEVGSCDKQSFELSSFAAGQGDVEIDITDTKTTKLGAFQLAVDATYAGMFSIGALWTPLISPGFDVGTRNGGQVITQTEQGNRRLAYTVSFTPFLWEGLNRDVLRPMDWAHFYYHINPSVGFVLNDPANNLYFGATFDVQSTILFTSGLLYSHVTELDGVHVGDAFTGTAAQIPTHKVWHHDWFIGVSVDARIGVKLLRTVLGTAVGN
jgi:hypothetical protein